MNVALLIFGGLLSGEALAYLNRLSDLLFVLARSLNRAAGGSDVLWQRTPPGEDQAPPER